MHLESPPPAPAAAPRPPGLSLAALVLGALALLLALPVLWWRLNTSGGGTATAELLGEISTAMSGQGQGGPGWLSATRASAMLLAFVCLITAIIALILKHSGRLAAIAVVLGLAALAATSLGLTLGIVFGVLLLGVLLLGMGIG